MTNTIKWIGSICIIVSMILTASNVYPINLYTAIPGTLAWIYVSFMWRDKSLICMNTVALTIYCLGIINYIHN
jgi:hypothetical protein